MKQKIMNLSFSFLYDCYLYCGILCHSFVALDGVEKVLAIEDILNQIVDQIFLMKKKISTILSSILVILLIKYLKKYFWDFLQASNHEYFLS